MTIITRVTRECAKQIKRNQKEKKGFLDKFAKKGNKEISKKKP